MLTDPVRRFFQSHVDEYEAAHYAERSFMSVRMAHVLEIVDTLQLKGGATILDAGCGPGQLIAALAKRGHRISGIDASPAMLAAARGRIRREAAARTDLCAASVEALPFRDACFDLVCSAGVIEYLAEDHAALEEFHRVLRPGGYLILPVTNFWSPAGYLDFAVEYLKRQGWVRRPVNALRSRAGRTPVRARPFKVRRHRPEQVRGSLASAGFELRDAFFFYFLPWPHPVDQVVPRLTARLGSRLEPLGRSWLGPLAEGYLTVSSKTAW